MNTKPPAHATFHVTNWYKWAIDAHHLGFTNADIRFVLATVGVLDEMRARLQKDDSEQEPA